MPAPAMSPPPPSDAAVAAPTARPGAGDVATAQPAARHRSTDPSSDTDGAHTDGQSVADLLARLQTSPSGSGRRRRRED